jgi:hypothetical protein
MRSEEKTVGYGYVAPWCDGTLGWAVPRFLGGHGPRCPEIPDLLSHPYAEGALLVKCKITIEVVKGKSGKPIRRRIK